MHKLCDNIMSTDNPLETAHCKVQ